MCCPGAIQLCSGVSWRVLLCCVDLFALYVLLCSGVQMSCIIVSHRVSLWPGVCCCGSTVVCCGLLCVLCCGLLCYVLFGVCVLLSCRGCALCCVLRVPWRVPLCSPTLCMHTSCHGAARHFWRRATGSRGRGRGKGKPGNWQLKKGK